MKFGCISYAVAFAIFAFASTTAADDLAEASTMVRRRKMKAKSSSSSDSSGSKSAKVSKAPKARRERALKKKTTVVHSLMEDSLTKWNKKRIEDSFARYTMLRKMRSEQKQDAVAIHNNNSETNTNSINKKTIVVYTGPTSLDKDEGKNLIYLKNFDYFLQHGINCNSYEDFVIVLTKAVAEHYSGEIERAHKDCAYTADDGFVQRPKVTVLERENKCYDMESMDVVFKSIDLEPYDHLVYLNCGVVGPRLPSTTSVSSPPSWTTIYTGLLSDKVKMAGLSLNCDFHPHVQSMLFALDRVGIAIIKNSGAVYDCGKSNAEMTEEDAAEIILRYEVGMGEAIIQAGYGVGSALGPMGTPVSIDHVDVDAESDLEWCQDMWKPERFLSYVEEGRVNMPQFEDFVFFKSSRGFLLSDVYEEVGYGREEYFELFYNPGEEGSRIHKSLRHVNDEQEGLPHKKKNEFIDLLWLGDTSQDEDISQESKVGHVNVVVSHCKHDLDWLDGFLDGVKVNAVEVYSKCGVDPGEDRLPTGTTTFQMPNVGRVDHTVATWMANILQEDSYSSPSLFEDDDIIVFLKDNADIHQMSTPRSLSSMIRIASSESGFACFQEPAFGLSQFHETEILKLYNMTDYYGVPKMLENGTIVVNSNDKFKSKYRNMGDWIQEMYIDLPSPLVPVCYGGIFAVKVSNIRAVPDDIWEAMKQSLSRGDNIEEGHFAERTWAGLLSNQHLNEAQVSDLLERADHTNFVVADDKGGELGALVAKFTWPEGCTAACYLANYDDLTGAFGKNEELATNHYWERGIFESRDCSCE